MADPPHPSGTGHDSGEGYDREPSSRVPRWVKLAAVVLAVLVLVAVAVMLVLGGHTPRRHG